MLHKLISYEAVSWFMWIHLMLAQFGEFSEWDSVARGVPQHKVQHQKCPESYIFLSTEPELHFPAGDVLSRVGTKGGTAFVHDLEWFHYLFSSIIN